MRALSAQAAELSARAVLAPVELVEITTYTDREAQTVSEVYRFSSRSVLYNLGGSGVVEFRPYLVAIESEGDSITHLPTARGGVASTIRRTRRVRLQNRDFDGTLLWRTLRTDNLERASVTIRELLVEPQGSLTDQRALAGTESTVLYRGDVRVATATQDEIVLELTSSVPQVPWLYATDPAQNDPRDLGRRLPIVYGRGKRIPAIGWTVGAATPLSSSITNVQTSGITLTDPTGFPTSATLRIDAEELTYTGLSGAVLTGVTRGTGGTTAAAHSGGAAVLEWLGSYKWLLAGHESKALDALFVLSPFNQIATRVGTAFTTTLADTVAISGKTVTSVGFTAAQLKALLDDLKAQAASSVTAQPTFSHPVTAAQVAQQPTSGNGSELRDGNVSTWRRFSVNGGGVPPIHYSSSVDMVFTDPGTITSQTIHIRHLGSTGNQNPTYFDVKIGGTIIGQINCWTAGNGTSSFTTALDSNTIRLEPNSGTGVGSLDVAEITRDVTYTTDAPVRTQDVAISVTGAAPTVGNGLRFYSDLQGRKVPAGATEYQTSAGALIETPCDVVRDFVAVVCGLGHAAVADQSAAIANLGSTVHALELELFGADFVSILEGLGFETRANIVQREAAAGQVYAMLTAESDYTFPASSRALTRWRSASEEGRDLAQVATRFRFLYAYDASLGQPTDLQAFAGVVRIDAEQDDVADPSVAELEAAEEAFGRLDAPPIAFLSIQDLATAEERAGYYASELLRPGTILELGGVPAAESYDLEPGDVVDLTSPTQGVAFKGRLLEVRLDRENHSATIRAAEVP